MDSSGIVVAAAATSLLLLVVVLDCCSPSRCCISIVDNVQRKEANVTNQRHTAFNVIALGTAIAAASNRNIYMADTAAAAIDHTSPILRKSFVVVVSPLPHTQQSGSNKSRKSG